MSEFNTTNPNTIKVLPDELEKKIEAVNQSLSGARDAAERFEALKVEKEKEVSNLEKFISDQQKELATLSDRKDTLTISFVDFQTKVLSGKKELETVNQEVKLAKEELDKINTQVEIEKEAYNKRKEELEGRERSLRIYEKSLEER